MPLVDTHAHLDQEEFVADRAEVLLRARAAGVAAIVAIAVSADSSAAVVQIAAAEPMVYAAVGIHPNYCAEAKPDDWERVVRLAREPRVVALGETGLDLYRDYAPLALQQNYFDRHLQLSQETGMPFIVHTRASLAEVLEMLRKARQRGPLAGVMHSFTGEPDDAAECVELGLYISFAGMVTFKNSQALRAVAATIPADRIVIETDSPYLAPHPLRGKRNEPAHVAHTAECLAAVRGETIEEFAAQTTANARRLFRIAD